MVAKIGYRVVGDVPIYRRWLQTDVGAETNHCRNRCFFDLPMGGVATATASGCPCSGSSLRLVSPSQLAAVGRQ
mgnify:CR=1 FL=1